MKRFAFFSVLAFCSLLLFAELCFGQQNGRSFNAASPNAGSVNVGVNVDAQTGSYTLACTNSANTDRMGEIEFNISSAATVTIPQASGNSCTSSNWAFVLRNTASSTAVLTVANQSTSCSGSCSLFEPEAVANHSILPGGGLFVYSDNTNYHALDIPASYGGVNVQTASYTLTAADRNKLVIMNCSSACAATLPATPPSGSWTAQILSIGSTLATVGLSSLTFNGSGTAPVLVTNGALSVFTNATNYFGNVPSSGGGSGCTVSGTTGGLVYFNGTNCTVAANITTDGTNLIFAAPSGISYGTVTQYNLACSTASATIANCSGTFPPVTFLGVFTTTGGGIQNAGFGQVNLDATENVTYNDNLCASSASDTAHDNGSSPCATGQWIGTVTTTQTSVAVAKVYFRMQ